MKLNLLCIFLRLILKSLGSNVKIIKPPMEHESSPVAIVALGPDCYYSIQVSRVSQMTHINTVDDLLKIWDK